MRRSILVFTIFSFVLFYLFPEIPVNNIRTVLEKDSTYAADVLSLYKMKVSTNSDDYWFVIYKNNDGTPFGDIVVVEDNKIKKRIIICSGDFYFKYLFPYYNSILELQIEKFHIKPMTNFIYDWNNDGIDDVLFFQSIGNDYCYRILTIDTVNNEIKYLLTIQKPYYEPFCPFEFIIYKGKRGIKVDDSYEVKEKYDEYGVEQSIHPKWSFYYWNPSKGKYTKDKNATAAELDTIHGSPDFFADAGLDYSKLGRLLTKEDIQNLTKAQLHIYRNAVYARHGRSFKREDLQSLFNEYGWYRKNPDYSDDLLTDIDKANIKLIQGLE
jgi:hypothetical protein